MHIRNSMWLEGQLPAFRRGTTAGIIGGVGLALAAAVIKLSLPGFPTLTLLFPAVLISAWLGGARSAVPTLLICACVAQYFFAAATPAAAPLWQAATIGLFVGVGGLIILVLEVLGTALDRYQHERLRLNLSLKAAKSALWEIHPDRPLYWNRTFYELIGLEYKDEAPPAERFFELVHPDDREKMREARQLMHDGKRPREHDEYRLIRPDGKMVWLENHRAVDPSNERFYIGITQDITARKTAEEKLALMMRELSHRIKNQYSVIAKIAADTHSQAKTVRDFNEKFRARLFGLSQSNDLLIRGGGHAVDLKSLLLAQAETFGSSERIELSGPDMLVNGDAAQYLGMAIHELLTNATKYGALAVDSGLVKVNWLVTQESPPVFQFTWKEVLGRRPKPSSASGFGSQVLEKLMPAAVGGQAKKRIPPSGLIWQLTCPLENLSPLSDDTR